MNRNLKRLFVGIAAIAVISALAPIGARADTSTLPLQYPWDVKLGASLGTDNAFKGGLFDAGLDYDFGKTTANNPVAYGIYGDYTGKSGASMFGVGVDLKFMLANAAVVNKPYVGVGIGDYILHVTGSSSQDNFGGKVFAGYDFTQQVFGEVDYDLTSKVDGVNPDAIGVRVGYRF